MRIFVLITIAALVLTAIIVSILEWYKKVPVGKALVRHGSGGMKIAVDNGFFVIPEFHSFETIDLTIREFVIELNDGEALLTKDNLPLKFHGKFYCFIRPTPEEVYRVVQLVGTQTLRDSKVLVALLEDKWKEALYGAAKSETALEILRDPQAFKSIILDELGIDVLGFSVEDLVIKELELLEKMDDAGKLKLKKLSEEENEFL